MFIGGCELFARVFFTLVDACLGDDEVLLTVLVEVTSPDDVVGTVEDFVHLFFGETLDCGVVVGDVESHYKLTEPVVFVELVHHLVDKVLLDFYFSQLIHGLDEDDPCEVGLLVELTVLFLGDNLLFYVVTRRLQLGVFVVQLLDFLVGVLNYLVFYFEVLDVFVHVFQVLDHAQVVETLCETAQVEPLENQPEAVAGEFFGGVPLLRFPALAVALGGVSRHVGLLAAVLVCHVGSLHAIPGLCTFLVVGVDGVVSLVTLDHTGLE